MGALNPKPYTLTPRVALVHHWLVSYGGAERVLLEFHRLFPDAPVFTAAYEPSKFPEFKDVDVRSTWLNRVPFAKKKHQLFPILRGWAFESLDLSDYDIVISSCSAEAKYVKTGPNTLHICYCYTPIRYYWSDYEWYRQHPPFGVLNPLAKFILPAMIGWLRQKDYRKAQLVDQYVTQSKYIQAKIKRYYDRDSVLIHPPVDTTRFTSLKKDQKDYYLIVGRQVAYKRLDLAVDAFNKLGLPLVVVGTGEETAKQKLRAKPNIEFRGFVPEAELPQIYANAKGLLHPHEEDYGLTPIEAQAAGTPVIAYGVGGAAETVIDGQTGVLFTEQTPEALVAAVKRFETLKFEPKTLRAHAETFNHLVFQKKMKEFVKRTYEEFTSTERPKLNS